MKTLSFKVSAKAARLIGRENVASADGALSELIKNSYDADATNCLVCFLPRYRAVPSELCPSELDWLTSRHPEVANQFSPSKNKSIYVLKEGQGEEDLLRLERALADLLDLWIIDNGEGMSSGVIERHWMVIGTNFKEANVKSEGGRTRSGAKGIGRFALDRLGTKCDLYSISGKLDRHDEAQALHWHVDWDSFDGSGKVLDDVEAELSTDTSAVSAALKRLSGELAIFGIADPSVSSLLDGKTGTAIRVSLLRDDWDRKALDKFSKFLTSLVPPKGQRKFEINLADGRDPDLYGKIDPEVLNDFDYRVIAKVSDDATVDFEIFRNELDVSQIDPRLFELRDMKSAKFDEASFEEKSVSYSKTFRELWPGQDNTFYETLKAAGPLEFELFFFKRGMPGRDEAKRYPYRQFQPNPRKEWLNLFGGIKIYRDNFAVRPYGEPDSRSYDWLNLGPRAASNPAAVSRKDWNVRPQNLAGTITISRVANPQLNDQSNREGIIHNKAFDSLRAIALKVISEFEFDRSTIHYNLNELFKSLNEDEKAKSDGAAAAKRVSKDPEKATPKDAVTLAAAYAAQADEIRELRDEQTMLRALATLGTVLVSFSHEMAQLQDTMGSRSASLADILSSYISPDEVAGVQAAFHPYKILDEWEADDQKIRQWFSFALATINADKRRRKWIDLGEHLKKIKHTWDGFLGPRRIDLRVEMATNYNPQILAFEIDLDSIFNNLILNSVEAFVGDYGGRRREILISVEEGRNSKAVIKYRDSGPGLSPDLQDPQSILRFAVTTKLDRKGVPTGTGLGMWILAAIVSAYGGSVNILRKTNNQGFGMDITLPARITTND